MTKTGLKWTIRFGAITPGLLTIAIFLAGGGRGYFEPTIFLFPLTAISIVLFDEINLAFILLGLIQYPLYGFIIDKGKYRTTVSFVIVLAHVITATLTYILRPEHFR